MHDLGAETAVSNFLAGGVRDDDRSEAVILDRSRSDYCGFSPETERQGSVEYVNCGVTREDALDSDANVSASFGYIFCQANADKARTLVEIYVRQGRSLVDPDVDKRSVRRRMQGAQRRRYGAREIF